MLNPFKLKGYEKYEGCPLPDLERLQVVRIKLHSYSKINFEAKEE